MAARAAAAAADATVDVIENSVKVSSSEQYFTLLSFPVVCMFRLDSSVWATVALIESSIVMNVVIAANVEFELGELNDVDNGD